MKSEKAFHTGTSCLTLSVQTEKRVLLQFTRKYNLHFLSFAMKEGF